MFDRIRKALTGAREGKAMSTRVLLALDAGSGATRRADYAQLAGRDYAYNPIAFRCVRMVSEAAASAPMAAWRGGRPAPSDDPVAALLRRPNPEQTASELLETFYGHLHVSGNAYFEATELDGEPRELHALRPDRVKVIAAASGWPAGWRIGEGERARRVLRDPASGRAGVLHMKIFNPACDHYGVSPLAAAGYSLDIHAASGAWNKALLENAARPSGALIYRDGMAVLTRETSEPKTLLSLAEEAALFADAPRYAFEISVAQISDRVGEGALRRSFVYA